MEAVQLETSIESKKNECKARVEINILNFSSEARGRIGDVTFSIFCSTSLAQFVEILEFSGY